jgi:hypothetical protein
MKLAWNGFVHNATTRVAMQPSVPTRSHQRPRYLLLFVLLPLLLPLSICLLFAWTFTSTFHAHPTDQVLIANFRQHQAEFNQLLQMFHADVGVGRIAPDFTDKPIPLQRWNEYRGLFRSLGLEAGIEGYGTKDFIWFHSSASGLATSGSSKGYVYTVQAPKPVVDDLDTASSEDSEEIYRQIEGFWYLYCEWT